MVWSWIAAKCDVGHFANMLQDTVFGKTLQMAQDKFGNCWVRPAIYLHFALSGACPWLIVPARYSFRWGFAAGIREISNEESAKTI
jgi:hypothetical protein